MRILVCALGALLLAAGPAAAQRRVPGHRIALDVHGIGASLSYARRVGGDWFGGVEVGGGGDFLNATVLGGRHFSEDGWLAYEEPDYPGDDDLLEFAHFALFARRDASDGFHADLGVRGSAFLHFDQSDDDTDAGVFAGPYASLFWGWRHLKVGPRVMAGLFWEEPDTREFGINVAPVMLRITLP